VIEISTFAHFHIDALGIHATLEGALAQGSLLVLLVASAVWAWRQNRRVAAA
jgi:hypothetical protein